MSAVLVALHVLDPAHGEQSASNAEASPQTLAEGLYGGEEPAKGDWLTPTPQDRNSNCRARFATSTTYGVELGKLLSLTAIVTATAPAAGGQATFAMRPNVTDAGKTAHT